MGFLVIIPFAALAGWAILRIFRWLQTGGFGPDWWRAFKTLAVAGAALGLWFGCFTRYQVANVRLEGFPIPVKIFSREKPDAPWVPSSMPAVVRMGATATDLLCGVALCLAPVAVAAFFRDNQTPPTQPGQPRA